MLRNKKILITGATGFIGANLARYFLKKGANISIFIRKTSDKWRIQDILEDVSEYPVDLVDTAKLKKIIKKIKPHVIIHAAIYGGYPFQKDMQKIIETNFTGTVNLINACNHIDFELFINTGSSSEYGIKSKPMSEEDLLEPISDYGVAKSAATLYCQAIAKREGETIVTLRLFSPYGYYEDQGRLIPSVIISCCKGENPKLSSKQAVRDFIFIEDVVAAYFKTVENSNRVKGEIFNIGYGEQRSVGEVVDKIIKLTGNKVKPEWGRISNLRQESDIWQADISKVKDVLKWEPKYSLEKGLDKTVKWFMENMILY